MRHLALIAALASGPAFAGPLSDEILDRAAAAPVVIVGEVHDNPAHHEIQADIVLHVRPNAIVFEMLTPSQAKAVTPQTRKDRDTLEAALDWTNSGWPDFAMYFPIFVAAPEAAIFGAAVPREAARNAMSTGIADYFGDGAADYGIDRPLPPDVQTAREDLQQQAHCDAMPPEMLPVMVDLQRLRDAVLARETLRALDATGGPVVLITGNGHARRDWGVPHYIETLRPDLEVLSIGQQEDAGGVQGDFDILVSSPAVDRPDPCEAFRKRD